MERNTFSTSFAPFQSREIWTEDKVTTTKIVEGGFALRAGVSLPRSRHVC